MGKLEGDDTFDARWNRFCDITSMLVAMGYNRDKMIGLFTAYLTLEQLEKIHADVRKKMEKIQ